MELVLRGHRLILRQGDITELATDAIVNAANTALQHGGGVAGVISRKGGPAIQQESDRIGHCPVGGAVITSGGRLKAKHVIHTVGPKMGEGDEDRKLRSAVHASLALADGTGLRSVALPAISTGIYGVPVGLAARALVEAAARYLSEEPTELEEVIFCLFSEGDFAAFEAALAGVAES